MSAVKAIPTPAPGHISEAWQWPLDLTRYDRNPILDPRELAALDRRSRFPHRFGHWSPVFLQELGRVAAPVIDALDYLKVDGRRRDAVQCVLAHEMYRDRSSYWAWTPDQWRGIVGASGASYVAGGAAPDFVRATSCWPWPISCATIITFTHSVGTAASPLLAASLVRIESIPN